MPIELSPSDRMTLVSIGELMHPGACMVCGNGTHPEGYVRLGVYFDYEGEMYLCMTCATQVGEVAGGLNSEEYQSLLALSGTVADRLTQAEKDLAAANEQLESYDVILERYNLSRSSGTTVLDDNAIESIAKATFQHEQLTFDNAEGQDTGEPVLTKSSKVEGRTESSRLESGNFNI